MAGRIWEFFFGKKGRRVADSFPQFTPGSGRVEDSFPLLTPGGVKLCNEIRAHISQHASKGRLIEAYRRALVLVAKKEQNAVFCSHSGVRYKDLFYKLFKPDELDPESGRFPDNFAPALWDAHKELDDEDFLNAYAYERAKHDIDGYADGQLIIYDARDPKVCGALAETFIETWITRLGLSSEEIRNLSLADIGSIAKGRLREMSTASAERAGFEGETVDILHAWGIYFLRHPFIENTMRAPPRGDYAKWNPYDHRLLHHLARAGVFLYDTKDDNKPVPAVGEIGARFYARGGIGPLPRDTLVPSQYSDEISDPYEKSLLEAQVRSHEAEAWRAYCEARGIDPDYEPGSDG